MHNLEEQINAWLSELRKNSGFEDGDIAELEDPTNNNMIMVERAVSCRALLFVFARAPPNGSYDATWALVLALPACPSA